MLKFEMRDLREFSEDDLVRFVGGDIGEWFDEFESGVFRISVGSRGEIEEVSKVEVIDGVFEVESREEMLDSMDEESREEMSEWVCVEMFEGVVSVCRGEEDSDDIVKLMID